MNRCADAHDFIGIDPLVRVFAEYLLDHGMVDMIVHRHNMKDTVARVARMLMKAPAIETAAKRAEKPQETKADNDQLPVEKTQEPETETSASGKETNENAATSATDDADKKQATIPPEPVKN